MRRVKQWMGGALFLGLLAAGLGGCGESESNNDAEGSGGTDSGSGGTDGGSGGTDGGSGGTDSGTTDANSGDETASSNTNGNATSGIVPGDPVPLEDYPGEVSAILCNWLTPCCAGLGVPVTEMACSSTLGEGFEMDQASADPNNYTYDPELAGDCMATAREFYDQVGCELGDPSSDIDTSAIEACNNVFQGKLEPGAACSADIECAKAPGESVECAELDFGSGVTVCVVERRAAEAEPCYWTCTGNSSSYSCSSNGFAETPALQGRCYTNDQLYCADGVCAAQASPGEACAGEDTCAGGYCSAAGQCSNTSNDGADCTTDSQCSEELYCESQVCTPRKADGEPCEFSEECQSDYCNDYECADGGLANAEGLAFVCALVAAQL